MTLHFSKLWLLNVLAGGWQRTRWQEGKEWGHAQCRWLCGCIVCRKYLWRRKERLPWSSKLPWQSVPRSCCLRWFGFQTRQLLRMLSVGCGKDRCRKIGHFSASASSRGAAGLSWLSKDLMVRFSARWKSRILVLLMISIESLSMFRALWTPELNNHLLFWEPSGAFAPVCELLHLSCTPTPLSCWWDSPWSHSIVKRYSLTWSP